MKKKIENIIFLDIDGVLNCEQFYHEDHHQKMKREMTNNPKDEDIFNRAQICPIRLGYVNDLCKETNSKVVVSSTWRGGLSIEELQRLFDICGGTFEVIGKTPHVDCRVRGVEIKKWLEKNINEEEYGCLYFDFYRYVIIDDDSDMLLNQGPHFFQTDQFTGITPNLCYKIKRFLNHKTF